MKEQGFEKVASKILKQQSKLGKLQGLSVEVKSLSDSVLKRLVKNGALAVVPVTVAALYANKQAKQNAAKWFKERDKNHKNLLNTMQAHHEFDKAIDSSTDSFDNITLGLMNKADAQMLRKEKEKERKASEQKYQKELSDMKKEHADKLKKGKKDWKIRRTVNTVSTAAAVNLPFFINFIRKGLKQEVLITAKYKYGTKVFKVYDASKYEIQSGIDKVILKSVSEVVARMKKNAQFPIKEDVTLEEFKLITLTESELESVMD